MRAFFILAALLGAGMPLSAATVYVNRQAPGTVHDGKSWATAFTRIQDALISTPDHTEIWVAAGEYTGALLLPAQVSRPVQSVGLYGGFAGTETEREQRDPVANPTAIVGERTRTMAVSIRNAYGAHDITVDGFTIRGASIGVDVFSSDAVISNNVVRDVAVGITCNGATVSVMGNRVVGATSVGIACSFKTGGVVARNTVTGGAVGINSSASLETIRIRDNVVTANRGAALVVVGSASVTNNTFAANRVGVESHGPFSDPPSKGVFLGNNIVAFNADAGISGWTAPHGVDTHHAVGFCDNRRSNSAGGRYPRALWRRFSL